MSHLGVEVGGIEVYFVEGFGRYCGVADMSGRGTEAERPKERAVRFRLKRRSGSKSCKKARA
jgi:hypothetical protein